MILGPRGGFVSPTLDPMIDATPAPARPIFLLLLAALALVGPASTARAKPPPSWRWPLDGSPEVVRGFDPPDLPWGAGHRGVDLAAHDGDPVYAAGSGRAAYVGRIAGRGIVTIVHGDRRTTYLPVRASVHPGDRVSAGTRIGTVEPGFSHCPMRVCLHWGLLRDATYLDPLSLLPRSPIRLLPLVAAPVPAATSARPRTKRVGFALAGPEVTPPPSPPAREAPTADLAESALAGSGGAGLVLLVLAAAGRAPWSRSRRTPEEEHARATAMRYHPAGGPRNPPPDPSSSPAPGRTPGRTSGGTPYRRPGTEPSGSPGAPGGEPGRARRRGSGEAPLAEVRAFPGGRHRRVRGLARLAALISRRRRPQVEDPDTPCAEVIDLDAERRIRRPTHTDERDPA